MLKQYKNEKFERSRRNDMLMNLKAMDGIKQMESISLNQIKYPHLTFKGNQNAPGNQRNEDPRLTYEPSGYNLHRLENKGLEMLELYCRKFTQIEVKG